MTDRVMLTLLKTLHTLIWIFYNVVIFYFVYAVLIHTIDRWVGICLGLIVLERILLVFKSLCPITVVARKYSYSGKDNFDIYLPNWLEKYSMQIYKGVVIIGVLILLYRLKG